MRPLVGGVLCDDVWGPEELADREVHGAALSEPQEPPSGGRNSGARDSVN